MSGFLRWALYLGSAAPIAVAGGLAYVGYKAAGCGRRGEARLSALYCAAFVFLAVVMILAAGDLR